MTRLARLASIPAALAAFSIGYLFLADRGSKPVAALMWVAVACLPPVALQLASFKAQLLARAVLWMNLLFGTLWSFASFKLEWMSLGLVLSAGTALLLLGSRGLEEGVQNKPSAFAPVALRGVLVSIVIMALADAMSLLFWAGVVVEMGDHHARHWPALIFFALAGPTMLVAVIGLLRLRTWGFLLNLVANVAIAATVWLFDMPKELRILLTATAVVQVLVGLPVVRAMIRGDATPTPMRGRAFALAGSGVVVLIMAGVALRFLR